jgi:hypothetical protein
VKAVERISTYTFILHISSPGLIRCDYILMRLSDEILIAGDLLENYCWDDDLINVARTLFCLTILLTFPLECFVARDVIENIFFSTKQPSTKSRHFGITLLIVLLCYVISISTDCLGVVLELNVSFLNLQIQ